MSEPLIKIPNGNGNRVKLWLTLLSIGSLLLNFGAGYAGKQRAEGEMQQRIVTLELESKRQRDGMEKISDIYVTLAQFLRRVEELQQERQRTDAYLMKTMDGIRDDLNRKR